MALASEVTWPTEFADLKRLDATLKCGICYDYMTNSMITSCSHTYCSLCIRKFMQYKNQCPACFEETYEIHLRNNRPLDDVISIFVKMKDKLQRALRLATIPIPIKENKCTEEAPPQTPQNKMKFEPKTPSSVRRNTTPGSMFDRSPEKQPSTPNSSKTKPSCSSQTGEDFVFNGVTIPGIFNTPITFPKCRKPEELAQCPVCHVDVPARNINIHLDSCLSVESDVCPKKSKAPPRRDPIPKRLYDLMQDKALKKVLKDYGLSTQGDRKTLIARIKRYTVIYNSENDSPNPRPVSELIAQLEREEREERRPNTLMKSFTRANQQQRITIDRKADPDVIDQAHKTYREENKDHFKKLIEQMRAREGKNIKPLKPPARVYSDDEDDPNHSVQFDPTVPSTSREDLYSLATQPNDDSDSDIFQEPEEKGLANGRIDWNKTGISEKDTLIVVSDDEAVDSVQPRQDLAVDCNQEGSGKCDAVSESHRETESTADHSPGSVLPVAIPPSKVLENHHILHSSPTGPNKSCTGDSNSSFSDVVQSMKQNDTTSNERSPRSKHCNTIPLAERIDLQHSEESNDADALFEKCNGDEMGDVTPRRTRTNRRSVPKSQLSTPSTSTRGTKRKSEESPETKMVDTFDYLFERFNGDRVNVDIESEDETTSGPLISEDQPEPAPRCTRRSTRSRKSAVVEESEETNSKTSRKRTKKDLSPAF